MSGRYNSRWERIRVNRTGVEKIFTGGRGCANLRRCVPGRGRGKDRGQRKW